MILHALARHPEEAVDDCQQFTLFLFQEDLDEAVKSFKEGHCSPSLYRKIIKTYPSGFVIESIGIESETGIEVIENEIGVLN